MSHFACPGGGFAVVDGAVSFSFVAPARSWSAEGRARYEDRLREASVVLSLAAQTFDALALFTSHGAGGLRLMLHAVRGDPHPGRSWPIDSRQAAELATACIAAAP